jgi:2',3'-cyclic-nucleotide 2'-phosphodiesterase (5'-nucleotidase family)
MKSRRFLFLVLLAAIVVFTWGCAGKSLPKNPQPPIHVTVLFFNDLHGHLQPFVVKTDTGKEKVGGIARLAALVKTIRTENDRKGAKTLVLVAGDMLQGTPLSTVFHGRPDLECFNLMGVDAMTVGNHEFDFGMENFLNLKKTAAFPFLSSNIIWKDSGRLVCNPSAVFQLSDTVALTVIGATTRQLMTTTLSENVEKIDVLDSVLSVRQTADRVKDRGPVILLSHSKHKTDRAIAAAVPALSAIIGGHDQILLSPFRKVGNVPVLQAFEKGRYLGRIDLTVDPASRKAELVSASYIPITAAIDPDPEIAGIVEKYYAQLDDMFTATIGQSGVFLDGERGNVRYVETTLGNFVTDLMRENTGAQVALLNGGSLRASIAAGPVKLEDIFKSMPYANEIVLVQLTGAELLQVLTRSVSGKPEDEDGGFLQVSGLWYTISRHAVENVRIGREKTPLVPAKTYRVAITNFLKSGGDGYSTFVDRPAEYTGLPLRELMVETVRSKGPVSAVLEGRIVRLP